MVKLMPVGWDAGGSVVVVVGGRVVVVVVVVVVVGGGSGRGIGGSWTMVVVGGTGIGLDTVSVFKVMNFSTTYVVPSDTVMPTPMVVKAGSTIFL